MRLVKEDEIVNDDGIVNMNIRFFIQTELIRMVYEDVTLSENENVDNVEFSDEVMLLMKTLCVLLENNATLLTK